MLLRYSPFWGWVRANVLKLAAGAIALVGAGWSAAIAYGQLEQRVATLEAQDVRREKQLAELAEDHAAAAVARARLDELERHLDFDDARLDQLDRDRAR